MPMAAVLSTARTGTSPHQPVCHIRGGHLLMYSAYGGLPCGYDTAVNSSFRIVCAPCQTDE
jgi:hypothetical protein